MRSNRFHGAFAAAALGLLACGGDDATDDTSTARNGAEETQTPPQGKTAVQAWLETGAYEDWTCEDDIHEARFPSPHGWNRICSNDLVSERARDGGAWPKGAAAVKELYADERGTKPVGYAVYLKTEDDSAGGANWYWYEVVPKDHPAPHDANGVVADGMGDDGPAKDICVSCHKEAGKDPMHTPSPGGRDQVYTPVP